MAPSLRRTPGAGFTLIEMLVAIAVFTILMIGLLNLLDNSSRISKIEAALADTQENVRYATYHLMRTARMMGGSIMPFARSTGGEAWVAGEFHDNAANGIFVLGTNLDNMPGSDVLVLRGFFDVAPFFVSQGDVNATGQTVTIRETADPGGPNQRVINDLSDFVSIPNVFEDRGIILSTGEGWTQVAPLTRIGGQYAVAMVTASTGVDTTDPNNRFMVLTYGANVDWNGLNNGGTAVAAGDPAFRVSRVGILEAYAYYVDTNNVMRRLAQRDVASGIGPQPVAINIGNLQVELGLDVNGDTFLDPDSEWFPGATRNDVVTNNGVLAMRMTVLGHTPFQVMDWTEPAATFAGAGNMTPPTPGTDLERHAKWRRMEVAVALRNFL